MTTTNSRSEQARCLPVAGGRASYGRLLESMPKPPAPRGRRGDHPFRH
ncbi:hypothetical protein [Kineococcus xinjiangensis]|nr:hypothetical protein [Kineococcus xinjiangensis]